MPRPSSPSILSLRVNHEERSLLEAAAAQSQTSLSDFVRRMAVQAAEAEVLKRSVVVIPAEEWDAFEAWLDRPAEPVAGLERLARRTPSWDA